MSAPARPHVVVHVAVSADGRIDGFAPAVAAYYALAGTWNPDAHLVGADTLLEGLAAEADDAPTDGGGSPASLLVVPDSRGRVDDWDAVLAQPFWGDVLVLCSTTTPADYRRSLADAGVESLVVGDDHVDYARALDHLADRGVETVLVDSGGTLSGHLLAADLVDELGLLVHPVLVGGTDARAFLRGPAPETAVALEPPTVESHDAGRLWVRYRVARSAAGANP